MSVCKKVDSDKLYFKYDYICSDSDIKCFKDFVINYYNEICNIFSILESYNYELEISSSEERTQILTDKFFDVKMIYDTYGRVNVELNINENEYGLKITQIEWSDIKSLKKIINNNMFLILKKIPVNVCELNNVYKKVIEEEFSKKESAKLIRKK